MLSESTTNYLSSGCFEDGAGNDQTSEGEKNVALSLSSELVDIFRQIPMHLCGRIASGCKVSSSCSVLEFGSTRAAVMMFALLNNAPCDRTFLSRFVTWC